MAHLASCNWLSGNTSSKCEAESCTCFNKKEVAESLLNECHVKPCSSKRTIFSVTLSLLLIINTGSRLLSIFLIYSFRMRFLWFVLTLSLGKIILVLGTYRSHPLTTCPQAPSLLIRGVRALASGREKNGADARNVSLLPLKCVLRVGTLSIGMPGDKKNNYIPTLV